MIDRVIANVEFDKGHAQDRADIWHKQGRRPRIHERMVRAENESRLVYVVVVNAEVMR